MTYKEKRALIKKDPTAEKLYYLLFGVVIIGMLYPIYQIFSSYLYTYLNSGQTFFFPSIIAIFSMLFLQVLPFQVVYVVVVLRFDKWSVALLCLILAYSLYNKNFIAAGINASALLVYYRVSKALKAPQTEPTKPIS